MKKILLALILLNSFLFSYSLEQIVDIASSNGYYITTCNTASTNSNITVYNTPVSSSNTYYGGGTMSVGQFYANGIKSQFYYALTYSNIQSSWSILGAGVCNTISQCYSSTPYLYKDSSGYYSCHSQPETPTCPSTQELINGECVDKCPSGQERFNGTCVNSCNQMLGEFRRQDGTCQDCSSYTNFSSRAFCACDSQDTTYTPHALISEPLTTGNYTYTRTNITCDNGLRISIYTDPVNINPNDYNSTLNPDGTISPDTNHTTTPPETNTTTVTNTTNDVVEAVKASTDVQKDIKTEMGKVSTDLKAMNDQLKAQGATFNEVLTQIKANGTENAKSNQLLGDVNTGLTQFKNKFGQWVDDTKNDSANQISAINGTTTAVNTASNAITSKLDEVVNAIKDSNGTGQEIDLNTTNAKLDTLHDDNNITHSLLDKIAGFFENNATVPDVNMTSQEFALNDLLPDASFFETNKLNLNLNNYHGECYLQTTTFVIAGESFVFPPPSLIAMIPFSTIANLMMAFLFVLGLRDFLRS